MMGANTMTIFGKGHHTNGLPKHTYVFMSREQEREWRKSWDCGRRVLGLISMWREVPLARRRIRVK
jgi:hypothetical protein